MAQRFYGVPVPDVTLNGDLPGRLVVLEGTDGVGRSTQMQLLRNWLEGSGVAVFDTGLSRGNLAGRHIQQAKEGHTMGPRTQCLFYCTDFADRLVNQIIPLLRAGYIVLTDRYIYSLMARAAVRGLERSWLKQVYGFALQPDLVLYLRVSLRNLIPRVLTSTGFDYWESGMDYLCEPSMYDAFVRHQTALLAEFERMVDEYDFKVVNADRSVRQTFESIQEHVCAVTEGMLPQSTRLGLTPPLPVPQEKRNEERAVPSDRLREMLAVLLEDVE